VAALAVLAAGSVLADPSAGIVVEPGGCVVFTDARNDVVWRIDEKGALRRLATNTHSHQLVLDQAGTLHGEHVRYRPREQAWEGSLWALGADGKRVVTYGPTPGFPPSLLTDAAGNRFEWQGRAEEVSRIVRRAPDGTISPIAGSAWGLLDGTGAQARLQQVVAMTWGPDGRIYFTDGGSVRRVALDGTVQTLATGFGLENPPDLPEPVKLWGLTVDPRGHVYVAYYSQRRVLDIAPDGAATTVLVAERPWAPTGVAVRDGAVYVLEHGFHPPARTSGPRVRVRDPGGAVRVLAVVE
jgi:sugar lactone lactonase YvrE